MPAVLLAMTEVDDNEGTLLLLPVTGCYGAEFLPQSLRRARAALATEFLELLLADSATRVLKAEHGQLHTKLSLGL